MSLTRRAALAGLPLSALALAACNPNAASRGGDSSLLRFSWWGNADRQKATEEMLALFAEQNSDISVSAEPGTSRATGTG